MALRRVFVIDDSPAIRETISVILAGEYDVRTFSHADFGGSGTARQLQTDLLIIGTEHPTSLRRGSNPPAGTPVLWLLPPDAPAPPAGSPVGTRQVLSRSFLPCELRTRVDQMLCIEPCAAPAAAADVVERSRIEPPFLSPEAADMVRAAIQSQLPVLVCSPLGMGRSTLARAIHVLGKRARFAALDAQAFDAHAAAIEPGGGDGTLFIDRMDRLRADGQQHLLARLQPDGRLSAAGGGSLRIIGGAEADLEQSVARGEFSAELYYRISVLPVRPVPLRQRTHDIPDLVRLISAQLAQSLGLPPVSFTPSALQRLSNYLWFGDVIELEAVLARTIMLARKQPIDADDLLFEGTRSSPATAAATTGPAPPSLAHGRANHTLELVVNELAHELKNPMVTIKTFAQHLRRLVYNGEEEEQVARLTGEAVDQIDQVIENLLQFTRFEAPVRESVALPALLGPAVAALAQILKPRSRRVDYRPPPPVSVLVDRAQMTYALTNLLRGLARGLGETGRITVSVRDPASIRIELPSGFDPTNSHLAAYLSGGADSQAPLPLPTAIANSLIERNGGVLAFELDRPPPTVTVQLPVADQEESALAGNGKASRPHRR